MEAPDTVEPRSACDRGHTHAARQRHQFGSANYANCFCQLVPVTSATSGPLTVPGIKYASQWTMIPCLDQQPAVCTPRTHMQLLHSMSKWQLLIIGLFVSSFTRPVVP